MSRATPLPVVEGWTTRTGMATYLQLAPDTPGPSTSEATGTATLDTGAALARNLCDFCHDRGVPLDTVVLVATLALLYRVTEQRDLLMQHAVAVPDSAECNLQPIRAWIDEHTTFDTLLTAAAQSIRAAGPDVEQKRSEGNVSEEALPIVFLGSPDAFSPHPFSLALGAQPATSSVRLKLVFRTDLYRPATANRLLDMLLNLLTDALQAPATAIDELLLTSPEQQNLLMTAAAGPALNTSAFEPVHEAVQRLALLHPARVGVVCAGKTLTYGQLLARASAIAEAILAAGVNSRDRVALCLTRSVDMPAALLAILLCGCVYVPLDPLFPLDRMEAALRDAEAALLLIDGDAEVPDIVPILRVDSIPAAPLGALPHVATQVDDLAYIIYTSGSTGKPKGVAISHGALRSLLCAAQHTPGFIADDVLVAITTLTFDISVMDMWLPLFTGATLVVATGEESRNPPLLQTLLDCSGATMMEATPGFWRAMVDHGWTTHAPGAAPVRVLCGGESMSRDLADLLLERAPEVWNMYGPTECTVWVSATRVHAGTAPPAVDQAMPNAQFYVLDRALQPVPPGITGELVIGGGNVGAGYWNRPELTAEKFVPNPFGPGKLYRTGDLAQHRPEGGLRLLGRADFQVKVRGFRIELGEIEHVLAQHPAVREAVVVQQTLPSAPGTPPSQPLVAFVDIGRIVEPQDHADLVATLQVALRKAMPDYMVPAAIVPLPELPRLFNGKVDRKALPMVVTATAPLPDTGYVAPRDFLERQLAQIWQETLGIAEVGVETSYFSLGADSLTALRLINRINRTFAMQVGLSNLLTTNSIAAIAGLIRERHTPGVTRALVPLRTTGTRPPLFLLHGVGGNVLNFIGLAGRMDADQPVYALQAQSLLTGQPALLRLEDMASHYIGEMQTVQPHGPYHLLGYSFGGTVAAEMARQLRARGEDVALLAMLDARTFAFEQAYENSLSTHAAVQMNMARLQGNTRTLSRRDRVRYITGKLVTRSVRYTCVLFHKLGLRRLPSCLKVAWDVNLVAFWRYKPQVDPGTMTLFRATQQDFAHGPRDLGWAPLFSTGVDVHEIDSDHERLFLEPALGDLAAQLTTVLAATSAASTPHTAEEVHA